MHGDPNGQPVLLLHGGLGNIEEFVNLAPVLVAAGYRVVAMDCRGRGRSAWGDLPITYEQMAADALGLLDHLGIAKTDVVGWSDGAIIALNLAIHHPERLDRVVAYGANFTPEGIQFVESDQMLPFECFIATYRRLSPEPERFEELLGVLDALYKVAPNYSEAELKSIPVPVLILDGAEDEFIKPDQPRRMAALIPGATLVIMPGHRPLRPVREARAVQPDRARLLGREGSEPGGDANGRDADAVARARLLSGVGQRALYARWLRPSPGALAAGRVRVSRGETMSILIGPLCQAAIMVGLDEIRGQTPPSRHASSSRAAASFSASLTNGAFKTPDNALARSWVLGSHRPWVSSATTRVSCHPSDVGVAAGTGQMMAASRMTSSVPSLRSSPPEPGGLTYASPVAMV